MSEENTSPEQISMFPEDQSISGPAGNTIDKNALIQEHNERASLAFELLKSMLSSGKFDKNIESMVEKSFQLTDAFKLKLDNRFIEAVQYHKLDL